MEATEPEQGARAWSHDEAVDTPATGASRSARPPEGEQSWSWFEHAQYRIERAFFSSRRRGM
jgi:hypothetical protein